MHSHSFCCYLGLVVVVWFLLRFFSPTIEFLCVTQAGLELRSIFLCLLNSVCFLKIYLFHL